MKFAIPMVSTESHPERSLVLKTALRTAGVVPFFPKRHLVLEIRRPAERPQLAQLEFLRVVRESL